VVAVVSTSEKREAVAIDVHSTKTKYVVTGYRLAPDFRAKVAIGTKDEERR
jgi:hypothetical protein